MQNMKDGMSRCRRRMECQGAEYEGWSGVKVQIMKDGVSRCII